MNYKKFTYKVVLLGNSGVGKTSISHQYVRNDFIPLKEPTIGAAFLTKKHIINNVEFTLEIWDTAGQERYRSLTPMYYRGAHFAIIVYDITNSRSLNEAKRWVKEIKEIHNAKCIIILVGNKCDLVNKRQIKKDYVENYCKEQNILFIEVSAKSGNNVNKLFETLLQNRHIENEEINNIIIKIDNNNDYTNCC